MRRIRLLRVLLPALLLPFVLALVWQIRSRPEVRSEPVTAGPRSGTFAERIEFTELFGGARKLSVKARVGEQDEKGGYRLEDVEQIELERAGAPPLVLRAGQGRVEGTPGRRKVVLEGGVEVRDDSAEVKLKLPSLEMDEAAGQVRSLGEVRVETPRGEGRAASVVYGLRGAPTELFDLELKTPDGGSLRASRAVLRDGTRDVELLGAVRGERAGSQITAETLRLFRPDAKTLRRALAEGAVLGRFVPAKGAPIGFRAERVEMEWDDEGRPWRAALEGQVRIEQGGGRLEAEKVEGHAVARTATWELEAEQRLHLTGPVRDGTATLAADRLRAVLGEEGKLRHAEALGSVKFDGVAGSGEAARAFFDFVDGEARATLEAEGPVRARWARDRMRVAADRLTTNPDGTRLEAEGRVEASLLPDRERKKAARAGLFSEEDAIHFVSARLQSDGSGHRLTFSGEVRGWQGDRNLSGDEVDVDQNADTLVARGHVNVRIPRKGREASSAGDYIQVSAERLDYSGGKAQAVFEGSVRTRQAEGWLEASRMEVDLERDGAGGVREVRPSGTVRFEFQSVGSDGKPVTAVGEGDRVVYEPGTGSVRLFGDKAPASVRRSGDAGATVTGRVLRYHLRDGSLEVESGERNRARARGSR